MSAPPVSELLPTPRAVAVPSEVRLAYVLRHFQLAYPDAPVVEIGYDPAPAGVQVLDGSNSFFLQAAPQPPAPNWREWQGQRIPFFFDAAPETPLLTLVPGRAVVHADVVSAAFYLLSGWQEYFSMERDRHGRFPYAASVQRQYEFVALPVVNYYFDVLKTAIEHVTGQLLRPRRWHKAPFAAFITHDVDNINGGWGTGVRLALRRGQWLRAAQLAFSKATARPAPWNNLEQVQAVTACYGAPSVFFVLGDNRPATNGIANADYEFSTPAFLARLENLQAHGAEIASHGSYDTSDDSERVQQEIGRFGPLQPLGNRFHYLRWEPTRTPHVVEQAGFVYDSTLGFAEHFGFRHSYCLPFFPFDFSQGRAHSFLEIPLNVMDATLQHRHYLQLRPEEMLPALSPMLAEIARFGGVATVLWHNANFDPANEANGPQQFAQLMEELRRRGAAFLTGQQIVAEL